MNCLHNFLINSLNIKFYLPVQMCDLFSFTPPSAQAYFSRGLDALHEAEEDEDPGEQEADDVLERDATNVLQAVRLVVTQDEPSENTCGCNHSNGG